MGFSSFVPVTQTALRGPDIDRTSDCLDILYFTLAEKNKKMC